ncbi:SDR family NAD(P)-dependent oxidoreductase [Streptomyces sp. NPDC058525]|uniref:SDR family NAD(P)-dependent oxidoreductase n=1 Tax=Streptomyces sp. NPDC058525 TaxID=3346538 RepID=UPI00365F74C9
MSSFLSGRTIMVTGATSGIGYETARLLAESGATVLLHGRTPEEARAAVQRLLATADVDAELLRPCAADFSRLDEVERLANRVITGHPYLDALVNNAAVAAPEQHTVTADGNELAFQVNFLAHYLLTHLLEPALTPAEGAAHVVRLCDPAVEIVNGAYYDRGSRREPAAGATEERTVKRLNRLADQLVGHCA